MPRRPSRKSPCRSSTRSAKGASRLRRDLKRLIIAIEGEKCGFRMGFEEGVRMAAKAEGGVEEALRRCRCEREDLAQEHRDMTRAVRYVDKVSRVHIRSRTPRAASRPVL